MKQRRLFTSGKSTERIVGLPVFIQRGLVNSLTAKTFVNSKINERSGHIIRRIILSLLLVFVVSSATSIYGQNTYTWIGADNADWAVSTNWSPARVTPAATDILQFNSGLVRTITGLRTATIGRFVMSNNTSIILQGMPGNRVLTIGNGAGTDLDIPSGSSLSLEVDVIMAANASAGIGGTLTNTQGFTFNTTNTGVVTTVTGSFINEGDITNASASNLLFQGGSVYEHAQNGGYVPTATWNSASTCLISGITGGDPVSQLYFNSSVFGNVTWNCPSQTGGSSLGTNNPTTIAGTLTIENTDALIALGI